MATPLLSLALCVLAVLPASEDTLPIVIEVELQPLAAAAARLVTALEYVGSPIAAEDAATLDRIRRDPPADAAQAIQRVLDAYCIAGVEVNAEARVKVRAGPAPRRLARHGWRSFLVKVHNEAGVTAPLGLSSPQAAPVFRPSENSPSPPEEITPGDVTDRWLDAAVYRGEPLQAKLSGLELEYCVVLLYNRDAGRSTSAWSEASRCPRGRATRRASSSRAGCTPRAARTTTTRPRACDPRTCCATSSART
jgi:hypothetical protein